MTTPNRDMEWVGRLSDGELESFIIHAQSSLDYAEADVKNHRVRLENLQAEEKRRRGEEAHDPQAGLTIDSDGTVRIDGYSL